MAEAEFNRSLAQIYQLILESLPRRQEATGAPPADIGAETLWGSLFFHMDTGDGKCHFGLLPLTYWAFLVAQMVKNLPALQETQVQSLGQEDPLEVGMVTHSSIVA